MSQLFRNTTVPLRPGRITRAARRRRPAPHEDAEDQGQADRGRREVAGRPTTTVLAYLARMGAGLGLWGLVRLRYARHSPQLWPRERFCSSGPGGLGLRLPVSLLGPEPRDADVRVGAVWLPDRAGKVAKDPIAILTESGRVEARIARPTTKGAAVEITQAVYQGPRLTFVFQT